MSDGANEEVRVIRTADRVELTHEQLQKVLKLYVETATGRKVDGDIHLSTRNNGLASSTWEASCRLLDRGAKA